MGQDAINGWLCVDPGKTKASFRFCIRSAWAETLSFPASSLSMTGKVDQLTYLQTCVGTHCRQALRKAIDTLASFILAIALHVKCYPCPPFIC